MIRTDIVTVALYKEDLELIIAAVKDAAAQVVDSRTAIEQLGIGRLCEDFERIANYLEGYLPQLKRLGGFTA